MKTTQWAIRAAGWMIVALALVAMAATPALAQAPRVKRDRHHEIGRGAELPRCAQSPRDRHAVGRGVETAKSGLRILEALEPLGSAAVIRHARRPPRDRTRGKGKRVARRLVAARAEGRARGRGAAVTADRREEEVGEIAKQCAHRGLRGTERAGARLN